MKKLNKIKTYYLLRMNYLITVVGITIVSFLVASPFFLQPPNAYESYAYGQGYDVEELKDSDEATEDEEKAMEEAEDDDDD
jgi:hypothetical protein